LVKCHRVGTWQQIKSCLLLVYLSSIEPTHLLSLSAFVYFMYFYCVRYSVALYMLYYLTCTMTMLIIFYRWVKWSSKRWSSLSKIIWLIREKSELKNQTSLVPMSKPLGYKLRRKKQNQIYSQEFKKLRQITKLTSHITD